MQKFLSLLISLGFSAAIATAVLPLRVWAIEGDFCSQALVGAAKPASPFQLVQGNPDLAKPEIGNLQTVQVRLSPMAVNEMNSGIEGWSKIVDYYVRQYRDQIHQILFFEGASAPQTFFEKFILGENAANRPLDFDALTRRWEIFKLLVERNRVPDYSYESQTLYLQNFPDFVHRFGFVAAGELLTKMENLGFTRIRFTKDYQPGLPFPQGVRLPKIARQDLRDLENEMEDQAAEPAVGSYRKTAPVHIKMTEALAMFRILYFLSRGESENLKGTWADGSTLFHQYAKQGDVQSLLTLYQLGRGGLASPDGFHIQDQAGKLAPSYLAPYQRMQLWAGVTLRGLTVTMAEFGDLMQELTNSNLPEWCFPQPQVAEVIGYLPRPLRPVEKPRHGLRLVTPDFVP